MDPLRGKAGKINEQARESRERERERERERNGQQADFLLFSM